MDATPFTVIAEFATTPESHDKFLKICAYDAARSVTDEPGCHRFDALLPDGEPNTVILYEVYTDRAAFDTHLTTPHYKVFADGVAELGVEIVKVRMLTTQPA
ncbi:Antibiotic biosynthesis monooxygenase [Gluconacetobacter diazotrophicus PA1 5]|uniref:Antibiotic biosynthesis monooxygenase n=2 Tax=Gluconacetobacter diazotrophicus TaxID=33996 RepID=A0A7W4FBI9_GLUDI|nr:antibiotic biosynthesis monooxygenase family protein [Gluconacetobacter diazotrophicus]ACI50329.1 Antibiotic biosynthesis monooxygenase [Gluconacetobacter diazotrophicus PA1 5]MBB2154725.1 antibiotic biosynthesis monooxygenase [Gluconacetobacter diazotrophicus]TWB08348.1 quinol monooxygenase YgiN [Gluconacetobacter diazotrophicus]CAP56261.1 putative Antibiotic biosynthesis monooxygenase [Gluconacetobacter diazotrophicus PA1 5]